MLSRQLPHSEFQLNSTQVLQKTLLFLFAAVIFAPFSVLLVELVKSILSGHSDWLLLVLPLGRRFGLLANSLMLAFSVSLSGMLLGVLAALFLWRDKTGMKKYLSWFVFLFIGMPPYIHALTWSSVLNYVRIFPQQGLLISWWVQLMAYLPLAVGLSLIGLDSVEHKLIDASRMMRNDFSTLKQVIWPHAKPVILAAGGFLFLVVSSDYSIPSLFSVNVYALDIFAEFSATNEPVRVLLLSAPLLLIAVLIIVFSCGTIRRAALSLTRSKVKERGFFNLPEWLVWGQKIAMFIVLLQILVMLSNLIVSAGSLKNIILSTITAKDEIFFSFYTAGGAALLCLPLAIAVAHELARAEKRKLFWWFLLILPIVTPGSIIGVGLLIGVTKYGLNFLYSTVWMPVLANVIQFTPLAAIVILAKLRRTDQLLMDASNIHQKGFVDGIRRVYLPMMGPGLLGAACLVFIFSLRELSATIIVAPPGHTTITTRIYNYLHYGGSEQVAGLCLVLAFIFLIMGVLCIVLFSKGSILFRKKGAVYD
tara:strand:+ start:415 stop:2019 length:1605 start_codon:yes stop_codon:yes gene_type:complete